MKVQTSGTKWATVGSIAEAQALISAKVSGRVSSSGWYRGLRTLRGAAIVDDAGNVIARVAYNGRVSTDADWGTPDFREIM